MATISVIVPVYKVEPYLRRCVDSILAQTYTDFELILVDDGSPDNCGKICDEYAAKDNRIKVIHQANGGLSAARNAGIEHVLSNESIDSITFVDSDDWVSPNYLETLHQGINLGAEVSCASFATIRENGVRSEWSRARGWKIQTPEEYWIAPDSTSFVAWNKLYHKSLFKEIRYPVGRIHEDVFTTHQAVFAASKVASCTETVYNCCARSDSITHAPWSPKRLDMIDALSCQREFFATRHYHKAEEYARGRLLSEMANVVKLIKDADPVLADKYRRFIAAERLKGNLPFWKNRDFYRAIYPKHLFAPLWLFHMSIEAICKRNESWLATQSLPLIKRAWYDILEKHKRN